MIFRNQNGYGLWGLLLIIILMTSTMTFVLVNPTSSQSSKEMKDTIEKLDQLLVAISKYQQDHATGLSPVSLNYLLSDIDGVGCNADTTNSKISGWCGPYVSVYFQEFLQEPFIDGWKTNFHYVNSGTLRSFGPNRTDDSGGGDDITRTF